MNKEVIYLEPEDDITDILTKLQQAEQKLVALVPPKKATMFRSAVNMKLVARTAKECEKVAVVVTADPGIMKLAMAAKIPVAKTLQSRPVIPTEETLKASEASEQVIDEDLGDNSGENGKNSKNASKTTPGGQESTSKSSEAKKADTLELDDEGLERGEKGPEDAKSDQKDDKKGKKNKKVPKMNRKVIVAGGVCIVAVIAVLVWALIFAPAVSIVVAISTSSNNFSHNVTFTTDPAAKDLENSVIYVEPKNYEHKYTANFAPTGKEDRGEKASGSVTATVEFIPKEITAGEFDRSIPKGATLTASNGKTYVTQTAAELVWDGTIGTDICKSSDGKKTPTMKDKCSITATIPVIASENGDKYNLDADSKWNTFNEATITNPNAISGGKTNEVTIVSQADIERVRNEQVATNSDAGKEQLFAQIKTEAEKEQKAEKDDKEKKHERSSSDADRMPLILESTFKAEPGTVESNPGVGQEVGTGVSPTASLTISYSVYVIPYDELYEIISLKSNLGADQIIYSIIEPRLERFYGLDEPASLKATTESGPTVTKEDILERAKGHKVGEIQSQLRSINGVSSVNVTPSYFWVRTVPTEDDRITIDLKVEDNE